MSGKWTAGKRMLSFETGRKEACQGSGADICVRKLKKFLPYRLPFPIKRKAE